MTEERSQTLERVTSLRREFDRSFAEAPLSGILALEDLLSIRVAGDSYVLRLAELSGLLADRRVVRLPSPCPEFLGVAGFRGALLPVYSLRGLLAYPPGEAPRWMALAGKPDLVGLGFDQFEGYVRIPQRRLLPPDRPELSHPHVRQVAETGEGVLPVLSLPSLLDAITRRVRPSGPSKER